LIFLKVSRGNPAHLPRISRRAGLALFRQALSVAHPPAYLQVDPDALSATLKAPPERCQVPVESDLALVIEYYSR